jgi:hypothetical protein
LYIIYVCSIINLYARETSTTTNKSPKATTEKEKDKAAAVRTNERRERDKEKKGMQKASQQQSAKFANAANKIENIQCLPKLTYFPPSSLQPHFMMDSLFFLPSTHHPQWALTSRP